MRGITNWLVSLISEIFFSTSFNLAITSFSISANTIFFSFSSHSCVLIFLKSKIEPDVNSTLKSVASPSQITASPERIAFGSKGYDTIEFFLSANPGELPKPLVKVASGGEVSRIMLAIKSVLKKSDPVETLIFDEIDSGISGQAAEKVALSLEALAKNKQVLCITHLPQIASRAHHHMYISKKINNNQTDVVLNYLKEEEKLEAIAGLFSGENISVESISTVKEFREKARG